MKLVILQRASVYQAEHLNEIPAIGGSGADAGAFFTLPIPSAVWERVKFAQDRKFVDFVETARETMRSVS